MAGRLRPFWKMAIWRAKFHAKTGLAELQKFVLCGLANKKKWRLRGRTGQKFILRIVGGPSLFHEKRLKKWTFGPISRFYTKKTPAFLFRKSKFQRNFSFMDVICFWLVRKDWIPIKETNFRVGLFTTISGKFFANYINICYKTEVQIIILRCLKVS